MTIKERTETHHMLNGHIYPKQHTELVLLNLNCKLQVVRRIKLKKLQTEYQSTELHNTMNKI